MIRKIAVLLLCLSLAVGSTPLILGHAETTSTQDEVLKSEETGDFLIRDTILYQYLGKDTIVTVPDGVTVIKTGAFSESAITKLTIPSSVISIESASFDNCHSLEEITITEANPVYKSDHGVLFTKDLKEIIRYPIAKEDSTYVVPDPVQVVSGPAFSSVRYLKNLTLSDKISQVPDNMLNGSKSIQKLSLGKGVVSIGYDAFLNCSALNEITLSNYLKEVNETCFQGTKIQTINVPADATFVPEECMRLRTAQKYQVSDASKDFYSRDGILYSEKSKSLLCYPADKKDKYSFNIPDGVTEIGKYAFSYNAALKQVTLPDSIKKINDYAFTECSNLEQIIIPDSVTVFGTSIFSGCRKLTIYCNPGSAIQKYCSKNNYSVKSDSHLIAITLLKQFSAVKGEKALLSRESLLDYVITLYNRSTGKMIDNITFTDRTIRLPLEGIHAKDKLLISIHSKDDDTVDCEITCTLNADCSLSTSFDVTEKGYIVLEQNKKDASCAAFLFDRSGDFVEELKEQNGYYISSHLDADDYFVVSIQGSSAIWRTENLADYYTMGLRSKDYKVQRVTVLDGQITQNLNVSLPSFEEDKLLHYDLDNCSYTVTSKEIYAGGLLELQVDYFLNDQQENIMNPVLTLTIPKGCSYIKNSLKADGITVQETATGITVPLSKAKGSIHFQVSTDSAIQFLSTAKISFLLNKVQYTEQIGSILIDIPEFTLNAAEQTDQKTFSVSGFAKANSAIAIYDGESQIGTARSNSNGYWNTSVMLKNAYHNSIHLLQARMYDKTSKEIRTGKKAVLYVSKETDKDSYQLFHNYGDDIGALTDFWKNANIMITTNEIDKTTGGRNYKAQLTFHNEPKPIILGTYKQILSEQERKNLTEEELIKRGYQKVTVASDHSGVFLKETVWKESGTYKVLKVTMKNGLAYDVLTVYGKTDILTQIWNYLYNVTSNGKTASEMSSDLKEFVLSCVNDYRERNHTKDLMRQIAGADLSAAEKQKQIQKLQTEEFLYISSQICQLSSITLVSHSPQSIPEELGLLGNGYLFR